MVGEGSVLYNPGVGIYWVTDGTEAGTRLLDVPCDDKRTNRVLTADMYRTGNGEVIVPVAFRKGSREGRRTRKEKCMLRH